MRVMLARVLTRGRDMALRQPSRVPVGTTCEYCQLEAQAMEICGAKSGTP